MRTAFLTLTLNKDGSFHATADDGSKHTFPHSNLTAALLRHALISRQNEIQAEDTAYHARLASVTKAARPLVLADSERLPGEGNGRTTPLEPLF